MLRRGTLQSRHEPLSHPFITSRTRDSREAKTKKGGGCVWRKENMDYNISRQLPCGTRNTRIELEHDESAGYLHTHEHTSFVSMFAPLFQVPQRRKRKPPLFREYDGVIWPQARCYCVNNPINKAVVCNAKACAIDTIFCMSSSWATRRPQGFPYWCMIVVP